MEMTGRIVGIDVSKDRLDVAILPEGSTLVARRDGKGLAELCEQLRVLEPMLVAIEATGGFESVAAAALASAGLPVVVVNPAQVRHFAKAIGQRAKTDPIECRRDRTLRASHQAPGAGLAGRGHPPARRPGRPPPPDRRHDGRRAPAPGTHHAAPPCCAPSTGCSPPCKRN